MRPRKDKGPAGESLPIFRDGEHLPPIPPLGHDGSGREPPDVLPPTGSTGGRRRQRVVSHERQIPPPSGIWLVGGSFWLSAALGFGIAALTLSKEVGVGTGALWVATVACVIMAVTCVVAHIDSNRGRKVKHSEIEKEIEELGSGGDWTGEYRVSDER